MKLTGVKDGFRHRKLVRYLWKHRFMYLMLLPAVVYYIIFHYIPIAGISIAFEKFNPMKGMFASKWVGFENFERLFAQRKFYQVFWNTLRISLLRLLWGFPFPIIVSLLLNELNSTKLKRIVQTTIYIPHFISWVVLGGILTNLLSMDGLFNTVIKTLGGQSVGFLTDPVYFEPVLIISMIWKSFGWTTIIYMAALSGVDPQLYEAAIVDGANRFDMLIHITLPSIMSTIIVVLILRIGGLMHGRGSEDRDDDDGTRLHGAFERGCEAPRSQNHRLRGGVHDRCGAGEVPRKGRGGV